jgi:hypothetical protein
MFRNTERRHPPPQLHPGKPAAHPQHQLIKLTPPAIKVYAEASGHRPIFCCPHNCGSSGGGRPTSTTATPPLILDCHPCFRARPA